MCDVGLGRQSCNLYKLLMHRFTEESHHQVLELWASSGSMGLAALEKGRHYQGVSEAPSYIQKLAQQRAIMEYITRFNSLMPATSSAPPQGRAKRRTAKKYKTIHNSSSQKTTNSGCILPIIDISTMDPHQRTDVDMDLSEQQGEEKEEEKRSSPNESGGLEELALAAASQDNNSTDEPIEVVSQSQDSHPLTPTPAQLQFLDHRIASPFTAANFNIQKSSVTGHINFPHTLKHWTDGFGRIRV
jgi:hypothetical protein